MALLPVIPWLLGLIGVGAAAHNFNDGNLLKGLGEMVFGAGKDVIEGGAAGALEQIMSKEAAQALLDDPSAFVDNFSKYAGEINWGAGVGLAGTFVLAAKLKMPWTITAVVLPIMLAAGTALQRYLLPNGFNKASGADDPALVASLKEKRGIDPETDSLALENEQFFVKQVGGKEVQEPGVTVAFRGLNQEPVPEAEPE